MNKKPTSDHFQWHWLPAILIYAVSALEVIIMVTPFAAYFYSVYTPIIHVFTLFESTAWLPQFFIPHLAQSKNQLFLALSYLGPPLAGIGLLGFLACAAQLYYGKFVKRILVNSGLYARVRHPQYLCLSISGLGFLLMWPRFFVLLTFLMMLGLYYLLARHEEEVIRGKYGKESERYMARISMFNPFRAPSRTRGWKPPRRTIALAAWLLLSLVSIGLAFLLRQEATTQLYAVRWESPNVTAISFMPRENDQIISTIQDVLTTEAVQNGLEQAPGISLLMQIATGRMEAEHLLTDLGMKAGAIQLMQLPDFGDYVVVSYMDSPNGRVDPYALDTRISPLFFVQRRGLSGGLDIRSFVEEQFYPDFYRILF